MSQEIQQLDLFIPNTGAIWPVKDDLSSMEHPIFSLAKNKDTRIREYEKNGSWIRIIPSVLGAATVFDKDVLIYAISQLVRAREEGRPISRRVKIEVHDFNVSTRRTTGGAGYERVLDMFRRLKGTTLETNIKIGDCDGTKGFGLIDDYWVMRPTKNGSGVLEAEILLPDWIYNHVTEKDKILTIHHDFFSLKKPLERRLYELARKHCGMDKSIFKIFLHNLHAKTGSQQSLREFRRELLTCIEADNLPEYRFFLNLEAKPQMVYIMPKDSRMFSKGLAALDSIEMELVSSTLKRASDKKRNDDEKDIKELAKKLMAADALNGEPSEFRAMAEARKQLSKAGKLRIPETK